jgi:hypothetical protein
MRRITNNGAGRIRCGFSPKTIDPVNILLCIAHQIRERQDHQRDNCLPEKSALIVAEPVQHPEKEKRQDDVET